MWAAVEAATLCSGMTLVPLSVYLSPGELAWVLNDSKASALVFDTAQLSTVKSALKDSAECTRRLMIGSGADATEQWESVLPDIESMLAAPRVTFESVIADPGSIYRILYTSATTGLPKGVSCENDMNVSMIMSTLANQLRNLQESDRLLVTTPLTHVAGMFFWPFLVSGNASILLSHYEPGDFCRFVDGFGATHAVMAPTLVADLVNHLDRSPDDVRSVSQSQLRSVWYAGSPIPDSVAERAEKLLGPILYQQYGLTEMLSGYPSSGATVLTPEMHTVKRGSCGRAYPGVVLRVVDASGTALPAGEDGEVVILMQAGKGQYWSLPEGAEGAYRNGWLYTGDTGYLDDDGFLFLRDRKSDMIVSGGLNVYPTEVESVLLEHPSIDACAVIGVPHPRWVEVPVAVVVLRPNAEASREDLIGHVRGRIAHYKAPKEVYFAASLPVSANGKLLRRELRKKYGNKSQ